MCRVTPQHSTAPGLRVLRALGFAAHSRPCGSGHCLGTTSGGPLGTILLFPAANSQICVLLNFVHPEVCCGGSQLRSGGKQGQGRWRGEGVQAHSGPRPLARGAPHEWPSTVARKQQCTRPCPGLLGALAVPLLVTVHGAGPNPVWLYTAVKGSRLAPVGFGPH